MKKKPFKRFSKLFKRRPLVTTTVALIGLIVVVLAYVWARLTYDQNVASGQPNSWAGILALAGLATMVVAFLVRTLSNKK